MGSGADKPLPELTDEQLVGRYRAGLATDSDDPVSPEAFEELVGRYRQELFHFLIGFVGDRAAAEDLFQEAFLQVHLSADSFDLSRRFKPWLFTIAANKARDLLRKNNRQQTAALSALVDESQGEGRTFVDLLEADLPLPVEEVSQAETRQMVRQAVAALPDHLREVMLLSYFNRLAYKEIAEMLGIPLGTVKSRLHAAVGTFSQIWRAQFDGRLKGGRSNQ